MRSRDLKLEQENGSLGRKALGENVFRISEVMGVRVGREWGKKRQKLQVKKKFYKKAKYF